ncbi:MAG TPA: electron transport complex subunit E [Thermoclostridium sp.]|nr:electron transport complex subunit E [Thermoclostridium sp.]HPU44779.1 electron transport complex subunit E [Thermoclostridium sp.]
MAGKPKALTVLFNGLLKENPTLVLLLGMCPSLAVTTMAQNAIGMGIAATFVLMGSNVVVSLIRKIVPDKVRIPIFVTVIAGFVTIVEMVMKAYFPDLDKALGIYIPLIVVNCIILARAEMFACKNGPLLSALDGLGMGLGFTAALFVIGSIREIIGAGTWMGITLTADLIDPATILILPPGGFMVMGCLIALVNKLTKKKRDQKTAGEPEKCAMGCPGCEKAS